MTETEDLYLIRFRYGRAAEMLLAYKTFLFGQVHIGGQNYCPTNKHARQTGHTLLVVFYSFIFSMFDKNGTHFVSATEPFLNALSDNRKKNTKSISGCLGKIGITNYKTSTQYWLSRWNQN